MVLRRVDAGFAVVDEPDLEARPEVRPVVFLGSVAVAFVDRALAADVPLRRLLDLAVVAGAVSSALASEATLADESFVLRRARVEVAFVFPARLLPDETYRFRVRELMSMPFSENIAAKSS